MTGQSLCVIVYIHDKEKGVIFLPQYAKRASSPCYCINLRRAAGGITELYDRALAPSGLTVNQYSLLQGLRKLEKPSVTALAQRQGLERSTLVRNLSPLLQAGYVRDVAQASARNRQLLLTLKGEEILRQAQPLWRQAQEQVSEALGEENLKSLMRTLEQLENLPVAVQG